MTTRNWKNRIASVSRRALAAVLCLGGLVFAFVALHKAAAQGQSFNPPSCPRAFTAVFAPWLSSTSRRRCATMPADPGARPTARE